MSYKMCNRFSLFSCDPGGRSISNFYKFVRKYYAVMDLGNSKLVATSVKVVTICGRAVKFTCRPSLHSSTSDLQKGFQQNIKLGIYHKPWILSTSLIQVYLGLFVYHVTDPFRNGFQGNIFQPLKKFWAEPCINWYFFLTQNTISTDLHYTYTLWRLW